MVFDSNCHLRDNGRLKKCIKNGNVVGFTLNSGCKTKEIKINDNFVYLEELPCSNKTSNSINFVGLVFFPDVCSYIFCYATANLNLMDFGINSIINNCEGKPLNINPFVAPERISSYTYVVYDNYDFKNGRYAGDLCLFNINNGLKLSLERDIKNYFMYTDLKVFSVRIVCLEDSKYKLAVSLVDKKGYTPSDTIYFDFSVVSNCDTLYYQIGNIFTYRGNNYLLNKDLPEQDYYSGAEFFKEFIKCDFMNDLVIQETEYKRRLRAINN